MPVELIEIIAGGAGAGVASKVLGPTAELLGNDLREIAARRKANLGRIFSTLEHKCGADELETPGAVPPRVLRGIIDEGSFVEDEVGAEYFGGVLASSRTVDGKDDAAVALIEVLNGLSSIQIRTHYLIYAAAQSTVAGNAAWDAYADDRSWARVAVPFGDLFAQLISAGADPEGEAHSTALRNLKRADLLDGWRVANPENLKIVANVIWPCPAAVCEITNFGIEVFCAAHGFRTISDFARPTQDFRARFGQLDIVEPIIIANLPPANS
jgi:hypothetical protein